MCAASGKRCCVPYGSTIRESLSRPSVQFKTKLVTDGVEEGQQVNEVGGNEAYGTFE